MEVELSIECGYGSFAAVRLYTDSVDDFCEMVVILSIYPRGKFMSSDQSVNYLSTGREVDVE